MNKNIISSWALAALMMLAAPALAGSSSVDVSRFDGMTPDQLVAEADQMVTGMKGDLETVQELKSSHQNATGEKDVLLLRCINKKIAPIKGYLKEAEKARGSIGPSSNEFHLEMLVLAEQNVQTLTAEALKCTGGSVDVNATSTKVDSKTDGDLRNDKVVDQEGSSPREGSSTDPLSDGSPYQ